MFLSCETREKRLKTAKKPASAFYFQISGGSFNRNADQNELVTKQERPHKGAPCETNEQGRKEQGWRKASQNAPE